jgi:2-dehydro-3-deoxyphosphogluconate aldolase / (4S)-4-hydroxy-2-oxoglutarate aldolase
MDKAAVLNTMQQTGLVPVLRAESVEKAIALAEAVAAAGVNVLEVTMTVPNAIDVIAHLVKHRPDILVGAGTVLDPETARACMLAGAQFFVTPALKLSTIEMAKRYSKAIMPGALTPTEVLTAWEAGADAVKIFPCGNVGGAKYIKALKAPFPHIEMVPTGGVNLETCGDFLKAGACAVGVGAELIDAANIKAGKFEIFEERARQFLAAVARARAA